MKNERNTTQRLKPFLFKILVLLILFSVISAPTIIAQVWNDPASYILNNGGDSFNNSKLLEVDGKPAIAFCDVNNNYNVTYRIGIDSKGTSFGSSIIVDNAFFAGPYTLDMAIINGNPAIANFEGPPSTTNSIRFTRANDITGTTWNNTTVIISGFANLIRHLDLEMVGGRPAIAYYDPDTQDLMYVRAADADGTTWGTPITIASAGDVGSHLSMVVVDGRPAISYYDATNANLMYVRATNTNGTTWNNPMTVTSTDDIGLWTSLEIINGNPAIAYGDFTNKNLMYIRASDNTGSAWNTSVIVATHYGEEIDLMVVDGHPAIAYYTGFGDEDLRYVYSNDVNGNSWQMPSVIDDGSTAMGNQLSMAIINGNPAISYQDFTNSDLKYVRSSTINGTSCLCYADTDNDTFGDPNNTIVSCTICPNGYVMDNTDCDDSNNTVYPNAPELCDGLDNNCDGNTETVYTGQIYVDIDATGNNNGSSWANAFTDLQDALDVDVTCNVTEIWVAEGTYLPTTAPNNNTANDRLKAFHFDTDLQIYGGFTGTETMRSQRDASTHVTTLSGNIGTAGNGDNTYHVMLIQGTSNAAVLDGFTITSGNANASGNTNYSGGSFINENGGGLYIHDADALIHGCTFENNKADEIAGAIIAANNANPTITNAIFSNNEVGFFQQGAAIATITNATPSFINCLITENGTTNNQSIIYTNDAAPNFINCTIAGNNQVNYCIYNDINAIPVFKNTIAWEALISSTMINSSGATPTIQNCNMKDSGFSGTTWNSFSFGTDLGSNTDIQPMFTNTTNGDYTLSVCSNLIDAGLNNANPTIADLNGDTRVFNTTIDMGAFESSDNTPCCTSTTGSIVYVKADAIGAADGSSWNDAFTNLHDALAAVCENANTDIWVAAGTYYADTGNSQTNDDRNAHYVMKNNVRIIGGLAGTEAANFDLNTRNFVANTTILSGDINQDGIDNNNSYSIISNYKNNLNNTAVLDGFTLTAAYRDSGIGGGAMYNNASSPTILNCIFKNNYTNSVGGAMLNTLSSPVVTNCVFVGNKALNFGGAVRNQSYGQPIFTNCTFEGNESINSDGGAIAGFQGVQAIHYNCIFWNNKDDDGIGTAQANYRITGTAGPSSTVEFTNCLVQGMDLTNTGVNNLDGTVPSSNPSFVQETDFNDLTVIADVHLDCNTSVANMGSNTANSIPFDVDGNPRIFNTTIDLGAYELQSNVGVTVTCYADTDNDTFGDANVSLTVCTTCPSGYVTNDTDCDDTNDTVYSDAPELCDGLDNNCDSIIDEGLTGIVYVDIDATGNNDGSSWANAFTDLQNALDYACGTEIWVAEGTYLPTEAPNDNTTNNRLKAFHFNTDKQIYGGFDGTETLLSQRDVQEHVTTLSAQLNATDRAYHVWVIASLSSATIIDGFVIRRASAYFNPQTTYNGGTVRNNQGGGMYSINSSPTIANCIFENNSAGTAPCIVFRNGYNGTIERCIFRNSFSNTGSNAVLSTNGGNYVINNSLFYGNSTTIAAGTDVALVASNGTNITLTNNTFYDDGVNFQNVNATCQNTIIRGGITGGASTATFQNCNIENSNGSGGTWNTNFGTDQGGNIDEDPFFTDTSNNDYTLQSCSPSINTGDNALNTATEDLAGNTRVFDTTVDMGVYEFQSVTTSQFTCYADTDGDGFGDSNSTMKFCDTCGTGFVSNDTDCDDTKDTVYPNAPEICDGIDNNCSGTIDDVTPNSAVLSVWTGAISSDWDVPCNWSTAAVPTATNDVIIPSVTNAPVIMASNVAIKSVIVEMGGNLTINSGRILSINGSDADGLKNLGAVTNNGTISIDNTVGHGIYNADINAVFTVDGTIRIGQNGSASNIGQAGITNEGIFNGGFSNFYIDNTTTNGIVNNSQFVFSELYIGSDGAASIGNIGLLNTGTIILPFQSYLAIENTVSSALSNALGGNIEFQDCNTEIYIKNAIENAGTIYHAGGYFRIDSNQPHINTGSFTNSATGRIYYSTPFFVIPNLSNDGYTNRPTQATSCPTDLSPALDIGAMASYTIDGIFTDQANTISAGNYNQISNTFTPSTAFQDGVDQIYYVVTTSTIGGCTSGTISQPWQIEATGTCCTVVDWYQDLDGDTFGNAAVSQLSCTQPTGYVDNNSDCNDNDANEFPNQTWYVDADNDDYGASSMTQCTRPTNGFLLTELSGLNDCDDSNNTVYPNAPEICDGLDNNCDGTTEIVYNGRVYVDTDAIGNNDGTSWANAFNDLRDALNADATCSFTEIWVAAGTYYPDEVNGTDTDNRNNSFVMQNNLTIYGGFVGNEPASFDVNQRDMAANETILSGDIDQDNTLSGNSYNVVRNNNTGLNNSAILDGFTITAGNSNGNNTTTNNGGGIFNQSVSPLFLNCLIKGNFAVQRGGGTFNWNGQPTFVNCIWTGNSSQGNAGANSGVGNTNQTFVNCTIEGNSTGSGSGGIFNDQQAQSTLTNCIIWNNKLGNQIGTANANIANNSNNASFSATYSLIQGHSLVGTGNLDGTDTNNNPLLKQLTNFNDANVISDLRLESCSPALNVGNNTANITMLDIEGNPRVFETTIDMGAYEFQSPKGDFVAPTALCQNITLQLDAAGNANTTAAAINNGSSDLCSSVTLSLSQTTFDCSDIGTNTVILTVADMVNNTNTCSATVLLEDNIAPTVLTKNITLQLDINRTISVTPNDIDDGSIDNCSIASLMVNGQTNFDCNDIGQTFTVILEATDTYGNISSNTAQVTIADDTYPCCDIVVTNVSTTSVSCYGDSNGSITIGANCTSCLNGNNDLAYSYDGINFIQNGGFFTGVSAGTYTIYAQDVNIANCEATFSIPVEVGEPATLTSLVQTTSDVSCNNGSDGTVFASANGGLTPYGYLWNDGSSSPSLDNVSAGTYDVTITDSNGCTTTGSTTVTEPSAISITTSPTTISNCGEMMTLSASVSGGNPPYNYQWQDNNGNYAVGSSNSPSFSFTPNTTDYGTTFQLEVFNDLNCSVVSDPIYVYPNIVDAGQDRTICETTSTPLNASVSTKVALVEWSPSTGLSCTDCLQPLATPTITTTYTMTSRANISYSEAFVQGQTSTDQISNWCTFRKQLSPELNYTKLTLRGSEDFTGINITDPVAILAIANALREGSPYQYSTGADTWEVSLGCSNSITACNPSNGGVALSVNASDCGCDVGSNVYTIRPEAVSPNWGGIAGSNCNAVSQLMEVIFEFDTPLCSDDVTIIVESCNDPCPGNYSLTGAQSLDNNYETNGKIESSQIILNSANVSYDAGTCIDLQPGFEVQIGAEFEAFIDGCNNGIGGNQVPGEEDHK